MALVNFSFWLKQIKKFAKIISMKKIFTLVWELLQIFFISLVIIIPIRYFVMQPFFVKGSSMEPNFENGDYLIIDELSYYFRKPLRGEVIVFRYPQNPSQFYIKRVIGLPGERVVIKEEEIMIYNSTHPSGVKLNESSYLPNKPSFPIDTEVNLGDKEYFVLGDNRLHSFDSRRWGPLEKKYIVGRVFFRLWPFNKAQAFTRPAYTTP